MGILNFFSKTKDVAESRTLVWDYLDEHPNATVSEIAEETGIIVNSVKAHKRNWQRSRHGNTAKEANVSSAEKPAKKDDDTNKIKEMKEQVRLKELELKKIELEEQLKEQKDEVSQAVRRAELRAEVDNLKREQERLEDDLDDLERARDELIQEISELESEAEQKGINLNNPEGAGGPMDLFFQGLLSGKMPPPSPNTPASIPNPTPAINPAQNQNMTHQHIDVGPNNPAFSSSPPNGEQKKLPDAINETQKPPHNPSVEITQAELDKVIDGLAPHMDYFKQIGKKESKKLAKSRGISGSDFEMIWKRAKERGLI